MAVGLPLMKNVLRPLAKTVKSLEETGLLIKHVSETFLGMLAAALGPSLLRNMLAGR